MPYRVEKAGSRYRVVNTLTGKVHAKHTTKRRAFAQLRLLRNAENYTARGDR